jgi:magnesium transporter
MASARTTYQDRQGGGAEAAAHPCIWVSLRDPSPEELAAVQREFGLPAPLVDGLATAAQRPVLELTGELLLAVVKTTSWVAAEEAVRLGEVQLVLGDGFVVSVDRDGAVLEGVRQDLEEDPELAGAGLAAVLPCFVDHAAEGYGPVLGALTTPSTRSSRRRSSPLVARARPTERFYQLSRQLLEFRRAVARSPRCWTAWLPARRPPPASGSNSAIASGGPICIWSSWPTVSAPCFPTCSRPT